MYLYRSTDIDGNALSQVGNREVKGRNHTYYQVLIDSRDCPHIVCYFLIFHFNVSPVKEIFLFLREHKPKRLHF